MGVVFAAVCMDVVDIAVLSTLSISAADGAVVLFADGFPSRPQCILTNTQNF